MRTLPYEGVEREALVHGSVQPGGRPPAPPPLDLVQAFVNTVDREHGPDLLDEAEGLAEWLAARGLPARHPNAGGGAKPRPSAAELRRAREVREALREALWANGHAVAAGRAAGSGAPGSGALTSLDAAAERARLRPDFATGRLVPQAGGVDGALGVVLSVAFAAIADGSFARLKACPGDRCGWAFYDRSPTASATWCSMRVCGGRRKAAAYYRRRTAR